MPAQSHQPSRLSLIHVTHEAAEQIGGIGAVLEGMITSPVYQEAVGRTLLVGPLFDHIDRPAEERLGPEAEVLYSSIDGIDRAQIGNRLRPIEWAFEVAMVYGRRTFRTPSGDRTGTAEILLIDVFRMSRTRLDVFKSRLWQHFGLDCLRYEAEWGFEEYVRLAEPAFHAALALLRPEELPAVLLSHEFMGLPAAFKSILDGQQQIRTAFHAHECATARRIVEQHPGHDLAFYNALDESRRQNLSVNAVFGDQSDSFRHALVSRAHLCDAILAVGQRVSDEMHFLDPHFDHHHIDLVHNGIPAQRVTVVEKEAARTRLGDWAQGVVGWRPDLLMTHVTRPVVSKGIWRDLEVCHELDGPLAAEGRRGLLVILTTAGGTRRPQDVAAMRKEYGWPLQHREGYPDLVGPEVAIAHDVANFNATHTAIKALLVNQFGWSGEAVGWPALQMNMATLRVATDVEFGMATYEPFGISPLEPLAAGAICVISSVCGCSNFVEEVSPGGHENVISANYTTWDGPRDLARLTALGRTERSRIEREVAKQIATRLLAIAPRTATQRAERLAAGQAIVNKLGWDEVLRRHMLPTLRSIVARGTEPAPAVPRPTARASA